jgi:prevent-host-death family protein
LSQTIAAIVDGRVEPVKELVYLKSVSQVSACEAKTHWSRLLARARHGESTTITDRGRPVARLVPASPAADAGEVAAAIRRLRERARRIGADGFGADEIRELIDEGRG